MKTNKGVIILRTYRPFLTFLSVYKFDNFRNTIDRRILLLNICRAIGVFLLLLIYLCSFLASELFVFIESDFDLNAKGVQFSYFVGGAPAIFVHLLLMWKLENIVDTLDYLHGIVEERELLFKIFLHFRAYFQYYYNTSFQNVRIGCRISPQLLANYEANEKWHARITIIMIEIVFLVVSGLLLLTAIVPFWYAIFGYPQPDKWALPVEYT